MNAISFKFNRVFVCIYSPAAGSGEQPSAAETPACLLHDNDGGRETQMARRNPPPLRGEREDALIGPEVDVRKQGEGRSSSEPNDPLAELLPRKNSQVVTKETFVDVLTRTQLLDLMLCHSNSTRIHTGFTLEMK